MAMSGLGSSRPCVRDTEPPQGSRGSRLLPMAGAFAAVAVLDLCTLTGSSVVACGHSTEGLRHMRDHLSLAAPSGRSSRYMGHAIVVSEEVNQERATER